MFLMMGNNLSVTPLTYGTVKKEGEREGRMEGEGGWSCNFANQSFDPVADGLKNKI